MPDVFDYAKLEPAAKRYLDAVRKAEGRGAPGMFLAQSDKRPIWAGLAGGFVFFLFLWIGYTSSKAPWATAMLQTAGMLLGGWLLWFAFRGAILGYRSAGWFAYFDPQRGILGEGDTIRVFRIPTGAKVKPQGADKLSVETELDDFIVPVPNRAFAERVADFYHALTWVHSRSEGPFAEIGEDEAGAVAKYMVEEDEAPANLSEVDLEIDDFPERIQQRGRPSTGILGLLVWLAIGGASYAFFVSTNGTLQDDRNFAQAREGIGQGTADKFTGAQGLRDYLLNPRNTSHRGEAQDTLAKLYEPPIAAVKNNPNADFRLQVGMVALLDSLRGPHTPAVSIAVIDTDSPAPNNWSKGLRSRFADGIATAVGKDLIVFGEAPADKPALLTIRYSMNADHTMNWEVEIRLKPDAETAYSAKGTTAVTSSLPTASNPLGTPELAASETNSTTEIVYQEVMLKLLGTAPPKPPVFTSDDW